MGSRKTRCRLLDRRPRGIVDRYARRRAGGPGGTGDAGRAGVDVAGGMIKICDALSPFAAQRRCETAPAFAGSYASPRAFRRALFSSDTKVSSLNSLRAFSPRMLRLACIERNGKS